MIINLLKLKVMKKQTNSLIYPFLLMGVLLIFASSCKKDKDDNNNNPANTFTDPRDGNVYKTVTIGTQTWMAENLRYLPSVVDPNTGSNVTPYYYVYGYNGTSVTEAKAAGNYSTYGVLYNWPAAMSACPVGWHLPSYEEWEQLILNIGSPEGGKLKETGTTHWDNPNTGATNTTGFTAIPGGRRDYGGPFGHIGRWGYWWCANDLYGDDAWYVEMSYNNSAVEGDYYKKEVGYSVRCVKD